MTRTVSARTKTVGLLLALEALALAVLVWQGWIFDHERADRDFQANLAQTRVLLSAAVATPLAAHDGARVEQVLRTALQPKGLTHLLAKDGDGQPVASAGPAPARQSPLHVSLDDALDEGAFRGTMPITTAGTRVGSLQYVLAVDRERESLAAGLRDRIFLASGAFLLSLLLFLLVIQPLARRLGRLQGAAERVAAGDYAVRLDDGDVDEVGSLARAFGAMAEQVKGRVEELDASRLRFHAIADYTYDLECWYGAQGELLWINSSVERLTGYSVDECTQGDFPWFLVHEEDLERTRAVTAKSLREQTRGTGLEFRIRRKDGEVEWVTNSWQPIYSPQGEFIGLRSSLSSVQRRKDVELDLRRTLSRLEEAGALQAATAESLRDERSRLLSLLSAMSFGVVFVDRSQRVVYANPAFSEVWAIPRNETLLGLALNEAMQKGEDAVGDGQALAGQLASLLKPDRGLTTTELTLASERIVKMQVCPVEDDERHFQGSVLILEDITQAREAENRLAFLAERDPLTGLYNRRRFERELAERLEASRRRRERVALFFFDLDEFKSVNDMFGHRMGDTVLQQVAGEIKSQLRASEFFARIGGDEFALVVGGVEDHQIQALADRLMRVIGALSVTLNEVRLSMTSSLGIAISPDHATDAQDLIAHADAAMYQAKDAGKNTWRIYRPDHTATLRQRSLVTWNDRIRQALRNDALLVYLQGVFDTVTRERRYSEALLRMPDEATGRLLPPSQFIPFAEKSNLIIDIDRWMIAAVIDKLAAEPAHGAISVNVSGRSFDEPEIADYIAGLLSARGVDPSRLYVEITETAAIRDMRDAQRFVERLRAVGVKVCLDDFGAGFATFAYIKQLPVEVLKIDGLFIRNLARSKDNQVFVQAMLDIARGFSKQTVAEAVEDEETLEMLRDFGVDMVQGFVLERPQPSGARPSRLALPVNAPRAALLEATAADRRRS